MTIEFSVNVYVDGDIEYGDSFDTLEQAKQYFQEWVNNKDVEYSRLELTKEEVDEDGNITILKTIKVH